VLCVLFAASIPPVCCMGMVSCLRRYVPCTRWWLYLSKIFSLHTNGTAADPIDGGTSATLLLPPGDTGNH
jgi:hypothetical protein